MCRHLAHLGPAQPLAVPLLDAPHSLLHQSYAPRLQRHGSVNADGYGAGWYLPGDPHPVRYRRTVPIWADGNLPGLARSVRTTALLAAVRDATTGCSLDESATAPFTWGRHLFSHNGAVPGWPGALTALTADLTPTELLALEAHSDSALLWLLLTHRLRDGTDPATALSGLTTDVARGAPTARLNLLLTDGHRLHATTWGDTLFHRLRPGHSLTVASEPLDDDPAWSAVPDHHLLTGDTTAVSVDPLKEPA